MEGAYQNNDGENQSIVLTDIEAYNAASGRYGVTFCGLPASELRTIVDVAIYGGETPMSETLRYSAESYAVKTGGTALESLIRTLFAYFDSAKAYFAKKFVGVDAHIDPSLSKKSVSDNGLL